AAAPPRATKTSGVARIRLTPRRRKAHDKADAPGGPAPARRRTRHGGPCMHDNAGLFQVVILLAAAIVAVLVARRLKASAMLGYLAAGVVLGPYTLGLTSDIEGTQTLAEFGVVFLLFSIGLDLSFKRLIQLRKEVFGLGTAQLVLTAVVIGGAVLALGEHLSAAIIIGAGLALSSTAIVMQILAERGEVATRHGRIAFSILLLQ